MRPIETRYAHSGDVRIAYQVVGQGSFDLVFVPGFISNLDLRIEATLGSVPDMFKTLPDVAVAGAWPEIKGVQLNPKTALDGKTKELLGLAVAAQIPCQYCIYFHTEAAKLNGAIDEEIKEAVAMAAIVRHWSTMLNGSQVDLTTFKKQADDVFAAVKAKSQ
ncbi:carboxymuconolactone decarboxylase family protein [Mesorhizobium sp. M0293]|uniref:carboxymuconolactone decarboxylase family protein n=1 Tax=unclassified Mesorhizobium TaxID=325217 RepID=UPI003336D4A0